MKFKALKHKTLPDTFGVQQETVIRNVIEIYHSSIPEVLAETATMEYLIEYFTRWGQDKALDQLKDYDLVTVQVTVLD